MAVLDNSVSGVYRGTKELKAWPMTKLAYYKYRAWKVPPEDAEDSDGYLVEYLNGSAANDERHSGYISWSPADVFERTYYRTDNTCLGAGTPSDYDWRTEDHRKFALDLACRLVTAPSSAEIGPDQYFNLVNKVCEYLRGSAPEQPAPEPVA